MQFRSIRFVPLSFLLFTLTISAAAQSKPDSDRAARIKRVENGIPPIPRSAPFAFNNEYVSVLSYVLTREASFTKIVIDDRLA